MRTSIAVPLLLVWVVAIHAAEGVNICASVDGKKLELPPDAQTRLVEGATKLLASCSNVVVEPKNTITNAMRRSHLEIAFTPPRDFDLGFERRPETVKVEVKNMVITLPVCSGGVWIESTQFRWFCSKFDTNGCANLDRLLSFSQHRRH